MVEMTVNSTQADFLAAAAEIVLVAVVETGSAAGSGVVVDIDSAQTVYFAAAMTEACSAVPSSDYLIQ